MRSARVIGVLVALALSLGLVPAGAARAPNRARRCPSFTVSARRVTHIRAQLASCREVRVILRAWARKGFRSEGPPVHGPWSCFFLPPHHRPECSAGKNGLIEFRLRRVR
jgi:hypothetical protein